MQWRIERLEVAESTNDVARERVSALWQRGESAAGLVVVALRQTGGRGQHGRSWESPLGGLYLSAVVEDIVPGLRGKLALVAGVAVAEAIGIANGAEQVRLRWPNDLMIGERKVGGILCEAVAMGEERWAGIVGIGINVATQMEEFPVALHGRAVSLAELAGNSLTVEQVLEAVLQHLGRQMDRCGAMGGGDPLGGILDRARQLDALRGRRVAVQVGQDEISGTAMGIGEQGELLVRLAGAEVRAVEVGTVISVDGVRTRG